LFSCSSDRDTKNPYRILVAGCFGKRHLVAREVNGTVTLRLALEKQVMRFGGEETSLDLCPMATLMSSLWIRLPELVGEWSRECQAFTAY
jgi:hypothetical protein